ncbi:SOUL hem-binding protein [Pelagophyceae sp. CCMP2097]|nr:SOUL hem-binding protein [Pelagophyceae sp. CCMP2097]
MLKRSPADLETPAYAVVESRGRWEVRSYEGTTLCQLEGDDAKGPMAFRSLAGYILSSQNAEAEKMSMTTPVMMRQGAEKREAMAFVIPQQYSSKPPTPTNAQIKVQALPPRLQAAIWFGGLASDDQVAAKRSALEGLVAADGDYAIAPGAECYVAAYNDPFTPPWKRRNEVLLDVVKRQATTSAP